MRRLIPVLVVLFGLSISTGTARAEDPQDILVIVNKAANPGKVSKDELKDVFLKKKANWASGGQAVPVHAPVGSELHKAFCSRVLGMSSSSSTVAVIIT